MSKMIKNRQQRLLVAKAVIEILRVMGSAYFKTERFGACADDGILCSAIFIGQAEGKPMGPSKLAYYAGMPRPSVVRKLRKMEAAGYVERDADGCYLLPYSILNSDDVVAATKTTVKCITDASAKLSKMDSSAVVA